MNQGQAGAMVERGVIVGSDGAGYSVRSLDRDGIITPGLKVLSCRRYTPQYAAGTLVYFFVFPDGRGMILTPCE